MPKSRFFAQKILRSFDRIDKDTLQQYVAQIVLQNEILRDLVQQLNEGILMLEKSGRIHLINTQAASWLGISSNLGIENQTLKRFEDAQLARFLMSRLSNLSERTVEDLHLFNPREIFLRVFMIPAEYKDLSVVLVILENRTEETAEQIDAARMARVESLVRLAAGVAHDIGNPLNSLAIHLELLKKEIERLPSSGRGDLEKTLDIIRSETGRMDRIVKKFVSSTRKPPLRFRLENLNQLLEEVLIVLAPELKINRAEVDVKLDRKLPDFFLDRDRLYHVFINLIKNAMQAMPKGGFIRIRTLQKGKTAVIEVQDQGEGIAEKDLPHIFDAYYTTKEEGAGLGLMTVYNAVSEHGGRIEVDSKPGRGSVFTLMLPVRQAKLQLPKYDLKVKK